LAAPDPDEALAEPADGALLDLAALKAAGTLRVERRSTATRVSDSLRDSIIRGALPPGTALREQPLADALDVSRNTVREALRLLSHAGLVTYHVHRGVTVKRLAADDVRDLYRTREVLELAAIAASVDAPRDALEAIRATVDEAQGALAAGDHPRVGTLDIVFHQQLVGVLGSERIEEFFRRVVAELRLAFSVFDPANHGRFVPWNRRMIDLLLAGERDACAREMGEYLRAAEEMILEHLPAPDAA